MLDIFLGRDIMEPATKVEGQRPFLEEVAQA